MRETIDYQMGYDHGFKKGRLIVLDEIVKLYNATTTPPPVIIQDAALKTEIKTLVALLQEWVTLENQVPGCTHEYSSDLSRRTYAVLAQSAVVQN